MKSSRELSDHLVSFHALMTSQALLGLLVSSGALVSSREFFMTMIMIMIMMTINAKVVLGSQNMSKKKIASIPYVPMRVG